MQVHHLIRLLVVLVALLNSIGFALAQAREECAEIRPDFEVRYLPFKVQVYDMGMSADGQYLAAATQDGVVILDAETLDEVVTLHVEEGFPRTLAWSSDGQQLAAGYADGVRIWDIATETVVDTLAEIPHVTQLDWSPDGKHLAIANINFQSCFMDGTKYFTLRVMDTESGEMVYEHPDNIVEPGAFTAWSPDSSQLVYRASYSYNMTVAISDWVPTEGVAMLWAVGDETAVELTPTDPDNPIGVDHVAWSSDGRQFAFNMNIGEPFADDTEAELQIWDVESGEVLHTLRAGEGFWSPDGKLFAHNFNVNSDILLWRSDLEGAPLALEGDLSSPTFSSDGSVLFAYHATDNQIQAFDTATGDLTATWDAPAGE